MVDPNQIAQNILQALQQQSIGSGPANHVVRVIPNADGTVSINLDHDVVPALIAKELAVAVAKGVAIGIAPFLGGGDGGGDDHLIKAASGDTIFRTLYEKIVQGNNIVVQIVDLGVEKQVRIAAVGSSRMPLPDGAGNPGGGSGAGLSWDNHEHPLIDPQTLRGILYAGVIEDLLDKGEIVTCYTGGFACFPYMFDDVWTEISPGVMQRNFEGPLDSSNFDGYDPDPYNPTGSPLLNKRVMAYVGGLSSGEAALTGPYIVDDIGGHYDPYDPIEDRTWVNTKAVLRRDPDFAASSDFLTGMTFHILNGTLFGGKYIQLTTSEEIELGTTPLEWDILDSYTPVGTQFRLLTVSQIYLSLTAEVDNVALPVSGEDSSFSTATYLDTLTGTPNVGIIPAGKWTFDLNCKVSSLEGDTTVQVTLGKEDTFGVQTPIFSAWTTPIRTLDLVVKTVTVDYSEIDLSSTDRLYVSFLGRTTSSFHIAIILTIADASHATRIYTPLDLSVPGSMRHPDMTDRFLPNQHDGYSVSLDASLFTRNLSDTDTDVQQAMQTLDQLVVSAPPGPEQLGWLFPVTLPVPPDGYTHSLMQKQDVTTDAWLVGDTPSVTVTSGGGAGQILKACTRSEGLGITRWSEGTFKVQFYAKVSDNADPSYLRCSIYRRDYLGVDNLITAIPDILVPDTSYGIVSGLVDLPQTFAGNADGITLLVEAVTDSASPVTVQIITTDPDGRLETPIAFPPLGRVLPAPGNDRQTLFDAISTDSSIEKTLEGSAPNQTVHLAVIPGHVDFEQIDFDPSAGSGVSSANLILNPSAELGLMNWTTVAGNPPVAASYPADFGTYVPPACGSSFFSGGVGIVDGLLTQIIDLAAFATDITNGTVSLLMSGWFGGWRDQADNATLACQFYDGASGTGSPVGGTITIGGVSAADRGNVSKLLYRDSTTAVPATARSAKLSLHMYHHELGNNDGYADVLGFVLINSGGGLDRALGTFVIQVDSLTTPTTEVALWEKTGLGDTDWSRVWPAVNSPPTGTGWRHVTSGIEDSVATTPSASDVGAVPTSAVGAASGVASLDSGATLWTTQLPTVVELTTRKGAANGYAPLDASGLVPVTNLPTALNTLAGRLVTVLLSSYSSYLIPVFQPALTSPNNVTNSDWYGLIWDTDHKRLVVLSRSGKTQWSDDGGATWVLGGNLNLSVTTWYFIHYDPVYHQLIAVPYTSATASYYSSDGGTTWIAGGSVANSGWWGTAYDAAHSRLVYVSLTENKSMYTADGGATWVAGGAPGGLMRSLVWDPDHARLVGVLEASASSVYSTDGGATWSAGGSLTTSAAWDCLLYDPVNHWIWAGGRVTAQSKKSTDGGASWVNSGTIPGINMRQGCYDNVFKRLLIMDYQGSVVYSSYDGGATWRTTALPAAGGAIIRAVQY